MSLAGRGRLGVLGVVVGLGAALVVPATPAQADDMRSRQWYLDFLHVAEAHQYSEGAGVTVAVLDTGVDATHPDLAGSVLPGAAVLPGESGDGRTDSDGHGTRMTGLIVGHGHGSEGSQGVMGVAPKATALPIRIGARGSGMIAGIQWATAHGAKVISISWGDAAGDDRERQAVRDAIDHDIVVVAAVGNVPARAPQYPAAYAGVVAVAGVDQHGDHGGFSVVGPEAVLAAPGAGIVSTALNNGYSIGTGTSDSTAIVAGAVALVRSRFPDMSAAEVVHRLTATAIDKGSPGRDDEYGYGIVNLVGALTADVPPLSPSPSDPSSGSVAALPQRGTSAVLVWLLAGFAVLAVVLVVGIILVTRGRRPV